MEKNAKIVPFFYKERKRTQRSERSFEKNGCPTLVSPYVTFVTEGLVWLISSKSELFFKLISFCSKMLFNFYFIFFVLEVLQR